jgi:Tol biopolymer transport system component
MFLVDLRSGAPTIARNVSGTLPTGGNVSAGLYASQRFSPTGDKLAYLADGTTDGVTELYSIDLLGALPGAPKKVNGTLVPGGNVGKTTFDVAFGFSPDGARIFYLADQRVDEIYELFLADLTGSLPPRRISGTVANGGNVSFTTFAPDSSAIAYVADESGLGVFELYYVNLRTPLPGAPVRVNGPLVTGGDVDLFGVVLSPDGQRIVYSADQTVDNRDEIFVSDVSSGTPSPAVSVEEPAFAMSSARLGFEHAFSRDQRRIVYVASPMGTPELWLTDVSTPGASPPVHLNRAADGFAQLFAVSR